VLWAQELTRQYPAACDRMATIIINLSPLAVGRAKSLLSQVLHMHKKLHLMRPRSALKMEVILGSTAKIQEAIAEIRMHPEVSQKLARVANSSSRS